MNPADDRARFETLAAEVFEPVQRYVRRRIDADSADDVVADVLATLWRRLDDVPDAALPWAYGVARRCLANARRSEARRLRLVRRLEAEPAAGGDEAGLDVELHEALMSLRDADREILRLWAWEGLESPDIAIALELTPNAASIRLHRAKRALADQMRRKQGPASGHDQVTETEEERS